MLKIVIHFDRNKPRSFIYNQQLSCKAVGLYNALLDLSGVKEMTFEKLKETLSCGTMRLRSGLSELEEKHLIERVHKRGANGMFQDMELHLFEK